LGPAASEALPVPTSTGMTTEAPAVPVFETVIMTRPVWPSTRQVGEADTAMARAAPVTAVVPAQAVAVTFVPPQVVPVAVEENETAVAAVAR